MPLNVQKSVNNPYKWQLISFCACLESFSLRAAVKSCVRPSAGSSINESSVAFRIRCTWLCFFVMTLGPEYKQDTLSHHFIQCSCKYFGGRHQLYLDRIQRVTTTTSDSFQPLKPKWISLGRPGTPGPLTLAETPLACLAKTQPRANRSLLSQRLTMNSYACYTFRQC